MNKTIQELVNGSLSDNIESEAIRTEDHLRKAIDGINRIKSAGVLIDAGKGTKIESWEEINTTDVDIDVLIKIMQDISNREYKLIGKDE